MNDRIISIGIYLFFNYYFLCGCDFFYFYVFCNSTNCNDNVELLKLFSDSFISMKFEENGVASWEKSTSTNAISNISNKKVCVERQVLDKDAKESKSVVEHGKSNNAFRWRKRIGRLVHFIPWKRSNKGGGVGHVEGVKVNRKGWMRTLTKRKTVEQKG